jgi:hypothetical protein
MAYSKAKLNSNGDKASPCFKPFLIENLSDTFDITTPTNNNNHHHKKSKNGGVSDLSSGDVRFKSPSEDQQFGLRFSRGFHLSIHDSAREYIKPSNGYFLSNSLFAINTVIRRFERASDSNVPYHIN